MLQNIQILVSQIIVMFLLIGVGAFCYRKKYINDDGAGQLSFILTRIVAPCVVIDSFQREFRRSARLLSFPFCARAQPWD